MKKLFFTALLMLVTVSLTVAVFAAESSFADVRGMDMTRAVSVLSDNGVLEDEALFRPSDEITVVELLAWLGRAKGIDSDFVVWAVENGIVDADVDAAGGISQEDVNAVFGRFNGAFDEAVGFFPAPAGDALRGQVAILLAPGLFYQSTEPVAVTGGYVSGFVTEDGISVFKGIPYAAPPVGDLRWVAPQAVEGWDGVRRAINWGASVIQTPQGPFMMWTEEFIIEDTGYSEDALSVNVWTRDADEAGQPVIFYLYGGGFNSGGASCEVYNGEYMASQGVVFVSINYRVGVMGFMTHSELAEEAGVSGNYAVLDAVAGLEWVRDNIAQFGGDPSNVTIMGQSAGAGMVHYLLNSPLADGLFHRAVSTGFNNILTNYRAHDEVAVDFEEAFEGYTIAELREMDAFEVMGISNLNHRNIDGQVLTAGFGEALITGQTSDVPLMTGMVRGDAALFLPGSTPDSLEAFETYVTNFFGELAEKALEIYAATEDDFAEVAAELRDDILNARHAWIARARNIGGTTSDTFIFYFTHVMPDATDANFGAFHTSEVPYFFNIFSNFRAAVWTEDDFAVGNIMSSYLINFARSGNPNGDGLAEWHATTGDVNVMELGLAPEKITLSDERAELFELLFELSFAQLLAEDVPATVGESLGRGWANRILG